MKDLINNYKIDYFETLTQLENYNSSKEFKEDLIDNIGKYFNDSNNNIFLIISKKENKILGYFILTESFFTIDNLIHRVFKITYFYILDEYRFKGLGTVVLKDIQRFFLEFKDFEIRYLIVDSYVESIMFFLNNGFNLSSIKKVESEGKNMVLLYKELF